MALSVIREYHVGDSEVTFNRIESRSDWVIIVDGVQLDLRGARKGASVRYIPSGNHEFPPREVALSRLATDGSAQLRIRTTATSATNTATSTVSTHPSGIIGATGQTVLSTAPGSITPAKGIQDAYRDLVEAVKALGIEMNDIDAWHPHAAVGRRHDWLYWAMRIPAYLIAHGHGTWSWERRVTWAETMISTLAGKTALKWYEDMESATAPTSAVTIIDPSDASVKDITQAVAVAGTTPTTAQLKAGAWPADLTQ